MESSPIVIREDLPQGEVIAKRGPTINVAVVFKQTLVRNLITWLRICDFTLIKNEEN